MQFQQDEPQDNHKDYSFGKFWHENLENFRSTSLHDAALERSTIFLRRSFTSRTLLKSSRFAELNMHFLAGQDVRLKKLQRSNLFPSTMFKYGLLEGSTFLFRYSYTSRTPLKSSRLGELEFAISAR